MLDDVPGALWPLDMIERARVSPAAIPAMKRVVISIAVSVGENSDETGIIVAGLGEDELGYVLADGSGKYLPHEWAKKAVSLYRYWCADRIIAEVNQGGDLVESTIRAVDTNVSFRRVHAKKGKFVRAEPISALFEQNRVKIAGSFPALEDQLCSYDGSGDSPDRLDSMVYALIDLMVAARVLQRSWVGSPQFPRLVLGHKEGRQRKPNQNGLY